MWGASASVLPSVTIPFYPAVNPAFFAFLWITLCAAGLFFMGWFFVYEVSVSRRERSLSREVPLAVTSSFLLGLGTLFLLLWSGLWV